MKKIPSLNDMTDGLQFSKIRWFLLATAASLLVGTFAIREYSAHQPGWVPGIIKTKPLPRCDAPQRSYGQITFVPEYEQPIVASSGLVATLDGTTLRCNIPNDLAPTGSNLVYEIGSSPNGGVLIALEGRQLGIIKPTGILELIDIGDPFCLNPDSYGADSDHFVVRSSEDRSTYRKVRRRPDANGELFVDESWIMPVEPLFRYSAGGTAVKASNGRWLALSRSSVLLGNSDMEILDELVLGPQGSTILRTGEDEYVIARHGAFSPLQKVVIADDTIRPLARKIVGSRLEILAVSKVRGLLLVSSILTSRPTGGLFKKSKTVRAHLELIDTRQWKPIASQEAAFELKGGPPRSPWHDAVFTPDGERLFVTTAEDEVHEIDIDAWINIDEQRTNSTSQSPPPAW